MTTGPLAAVTALALLFVPAAAAAGPLTISFDVSDQGELAAQLGDEFRFTGDADADDFFASGTAELVAALSSLDVGIGRTTYTYGPGTLTLALETVDGDGNFVSGSFTAETRSFSFTVLEDSDPLFGGGINDDAFDILLGAGLFDAPLARAFGVRRTTSGGSIGQNFLEAIGGAPNDSFREGFYALGEANVDIDARAVPEPGLSLLLSAAAAAALARRRAKRG